MARFKLFFKYNTLILHYLANQPIKTHTTCLSNEPNNQMPSLKGASQLGLKSQHLSMVHLIPAKPLHDSDTVSVHFNHFYCNGICDKLSRHLSVLTYIY